MIDRRIKYEEIEKDGDRVKRKKIAYKPNSVSNGYDHYPNVIPIGPIPHEKPFWEDDEEASKKLLKHRLASYDPVLDPMAEAFQYWSEYKANHPDGHKFRSLKDFISYITATEDYDPNYRNGGLVGLWLQRFNRGK